MTDTKEDRRCGTCKHATQRNMSRHYRRWCVECSVADHHVRRAERAIKRLAIMPSSVHGPVAAWMDVDGGSECAYWEQGPNVFDRLA